MRRIALIATFLAASFVGACAEDKAGAENPLGFDLSVPWAFVQFDESGQIVKTLIVRFGSDAAKGACIGDGVKTTKILSDSSGKSEPMAAAMYWMTEQEFILDLNPGVCDAAELYWGKPSGEGIAGDYYPSYGWIQETTGTFAAVPLNGIE